LRRPTDEVDDLLGILITEDLSRIATGAFDGDADAHFGIIADAAVEQYVRNALFGAATPVAEKTSTRICLRPSSGLTISSDSTSAGSA
jgi:uncharacterized protein DUF1186